MLRLTPDSGSGTLAALTGSLNLSHAASTTAINTLNGVTLAWSEAPDSTAIALPSSGATGDAARAVGITQSSSAAMTVIRATVSRILTIGGTARTHSATRDWALTISAQ